MSTAVPVKFLRSDFLISFNVRTQAVENPVCRNLSNRLSDVRYGSAFAIIRKSAPELVPQIEMEIISASNYKEALVVE